ncbi:Ribosome biogenesis protein MAK21 [Smittium mucronatum]|uniref:Ribosome biogenesis protein MAK21 n=1 Tax=Smittium mucronatum TaxID=133383 RepID=A0A1R0GLG4_9FUNG|nr:Ribosome biogenesis protein MAK21 [Smittium mucronatum]
MAKKSDSLKPLKKKIERKPNKKPENDDIEALDIEPKAPISIDSDLHQSVKDFATSLGIGIESSPKNLKEKNSVPKKKSKDKAKAPKSSPKNEIIPGTTSDQLLLEKNIRTLKTPMKKSSDSNHLETKNTKPTPIPKQRASESISKNPPKGVKTIFGDDGSKSVVINQQDGPLLSGKNTKLYIEPNPIWYNHKIPEADVKNTSNNSGDVEALSKSEKYARDLLDLENRTYESRRKHGKESSMTSNDMDFVSSILRTGTLSDKISALTLLVQESPIHNMASLNTLMGMARKKHRREAIMAVSSLKDLLVNNLLPDRKLVYFADRNWQSADNIKPQVWIYWIFEDFLKKSFFELIKIMEEMLYDTVEHTQVSALVHIKDLLESKPEQEQNLLRLLITKLGDKSKKIASKSSFLVLQLLNKHPNMKSIVIKTIQELLLSKIKHENERGQYYAMITLNQIVLTSRDFAAANSLIDAFLSFFQTIASKNEKFGEDSKKKKGNKPEKSTYIRKAYYGRNAMIKSKSKAAEDIESESKSLENRLMAAILTGLNRALPFSNLPPESWEKYTDLLFRVSHSANFNIVIQTLLFLFQITKTGSIAYMKPKIRNLWKSPQANVPAEQSKSQPQTSVSEIDSSETTTNVDADSSKFAYDPYKREPQYANAGNSKCWETIIMIKHYHPAVALQVVKLIRGERIEKTTNLHIHSLSHFLDRFVYRKPKKEMKKKGNSIMQPLILNDGSQDSLLNSGNILGSSQLTWAKDASISGSNSTKILLSNRVKKDLNEFLEKSAENSSSQAQNPNNNISSDTNADQDQNQNTDLKSVLGNKKHQIIPRYLVENENSISAENLFFHRFNKMRSSKSKSAKKLDDDNFDILNEGDDGEHDDYSGDDSDVANEIDPSYLADDQTGFSSALMQAESSNKKNKSSKKSKLGEFDDDLSDDEVWKAMSAGMPDIEDDDDMDGLDDDDDIGFDQDDFGEDSDALDLSEDGSEGFDEFSDIDDDELEKSNPLPKKNGKVSKNAQLATQGSINPDDDEFDSDDFDFDSADDLDMLLDDDDDGEYSSTSKKRKSISKSGEQKSTNKSNPKKKSKKTKLPMMASFEDYAALIDG